MAWLGLLATLVWNFLNYRRGRATICQVARRVPAAPLLLMVTGAFGWLVAHLLNGYPKE